MFLNIYKDNTMFLNVILPCLLVFVLDMYHFNNVFSRGGHRLIFLI